MYDISIYLCDVCNVCMIYLFIYLCDVCNVCMIYLSLYVMYVCMIYLSTSPGLVSVMTKARMCPGLSIDALTNKIKRGVGDFSNHSIPKLGRKQIAEIKV